LSNDCGGERTVPESSEPAEAALRDFVVFLMPVTQRIGLVTNAPQRLPDVGYEQSVTPERRLKGLHIDTGQRVPQVSRCICE
jgi:hypothetical protein